MYCIIYIQLCSNLTYASVDGFNSECTNLVGLIPRQILHGKTSTTLQDALLSLKYVDVTMYDLVKHKLLERKLVVNKTINLLPA